MTSTRAEPLGAGSGRGVGVGVGIGAELASLNASIADLGSRSLWALSVDDLTRLAHGLRQTSDRIAALLLSVTLEASDRELPAVAGKTSVGAWLSDILRSSPAEGTRTAGFAVALESWELTRAALGAGDLTVAQARIIVAALDDLPSDLEATAVDRAERHLIELAGQHHDRQLKRLADYVLHVVDPERADQLLGEKLEREEAAAARRCFFTVRDQGDGTMLGSFRISVLHGSMLKTNLDALANPGRPDPIPMTAFGPESGAEADTGPDTGQAAGSTAGPAAGPGTGSAPSTRFPRPRPEIMGEAFTQWIEAMPAADALPTTGGGNATVIVTMTLEALLDRHRAAGLLGTGHDLSASEARRLACANGIIPAVLGGASQVLDLGRKRRLHTKAQRLAIALEQGGVCGVEHCDRPTAWCDAHHPQAWSEQGSTSLANGVLLCPRHHTLAHRPGAHLQRQPHGKLRFVART